MESPALASQTYFSDYADGFGKSWYRPMAASVQLALQTIALGGCLTCEEAFRFLMHEIAKVRGKKHAKPTIQQRHMVLRIHTLAHQYRSSTGETALSTMRFGESKEAASDFLRMLEEAGCIKVTDTYWRRDKNHSQNNRSKHYYIDPLFLAALDFIVASYQAGYDNLFLNRYHRVHLDTISYHTTYKSIQIDINQDTPSELSSSSPEFACHLLSSEDGGDGVGGQREFSRRELYVAKRNRNRIAKLWCVPTAAEKQLLAEKATLRCHSVTLGAEVSDEAVVTEIRRKYEFDWIEKFLEEADTWLPPEYHSRFNVNIKRDGHGNVYGIGTRCYNMMCGTKNEEKPDTIRPEELRKLGLMPDEDHHYDVHCSIYSVKRALDTGYFHPADIYASIAEKLRITRKATKKPIMRANFGCFADQAARNPFGKRAKCRIKDTSITYGEFQRAMREAGAEPMGTDTSVFYHEGAIYTIARYILLREYGIRSICVYDSFYLSEKKDAALMLKVLNKALAIYDGRLPSPVQY